VSIEQLDNIILSENILHIIRSEKRLLKLKASLNPSNYSNNIVFGDLIKNVDFTSLYNSIYNNKEDEEEED